MLRVFFALFSLIADYETVTGIAQFAFRLGIVGVSTFACSGVLVAIRQRLAHRHRGDFEDQCDRLVAGSKESRK